MLLGRVCDHLRVMYPTADHEALAQRVLTAIGIDAATASQTDSEASGTQGWSAEDVVLITYGDSVLSETGRPLQALATFAEQYLVDVISAIHVLPFSPYSSDRGFAVVDYETVDPNLGTWSDIDRLGRAFRLMMDLVVNHTSSESAWFRGFLAGEPDYDDFFITMDGDPDLSAVVRPRSLPLLHDFDSNAGVRSVWTTFSHDQADLNFANPAVLVAMLRIVALYLRHDAKMFRLDAIGFLWKEIGTSCMHLHQTHEFVKLLRTLLSARSPEALVVTETNVAHQDNISYFGQGDEAHIVYNFSLAPLVVHGVLTGKSDPLVGWLRDLNAPSAGCTFLNFLSSHDGIGLRPAEGILTSDDIEALVGRAESAGGTFATYDSLAGPRPYELNVSLLDLFGGDEHLVARYLCAHAIMLAVPGIPAIYLNSLLATGNDIARMRESGVRREINRPSVTLAEVAALDGDRLEIFTALRTLVVARRGHGAFHPAATMVIPDARPGIVAIERTSPDRTQRLLALHNVRNAEVEVDVAGRAVELLTGAAWIGSRTLAPYQSAWLDVG